VRHRGRRILEAQGYESVALNDGLAGQGVYPAALTDDQAVKLGADAAGSIPTEPAEIAQCVREGLENIARGERSAS